MSDKLIKSQIKKEHTIKQTDIGIIVEKKTEFFRDVVQKTILHVQKNKVFDILGISDLNSCIDTLTDLSKKIKELSELNIKQTDTDVLISNLQVINNELSGLFKNYGTDKFEDLLLVCFGNNSKIAYNDNDSLKLELINKYFHPTSYKIINKKDASSKSKKSDDDIINEETKSMECFDILNTHKQFYMKVNGIKLYIYNNVLKKGLIVYGIVDNIILDFLNSKYVLNKQNQIFDSLPNEPDFQSPLFQRYVKSLDIKDYLICEKPSDIYEKFAGYLSRINGIKQKSIAQNVKDFISDEMFLKRNTLIHLLINPDNYENQYLAYLLYDLLSNDTNGNIDTQEQTSLFDSFPWEIKQCFRNAMKKTVQYTNELSNFDVNKIPLEQQICLLKVSDNIKEKAMTKLKEIKAKSEDSGSKARQYLDGLLKIPFNIYRKEQALTLMDTIRQQFIDIYKKYDIEKVVPEIPLKDKYTSIEIIQNIKLIKNKLGPNIYTNEYLKNMVKNITVGDKHELSNTITKINTALTENKFEDYTFTIISKKKCDLKVAIETFVDGIKDNNDIIQVIDKLFIPSSSKINKNCLFKDIDTLNSNLIKITDYMNKVKTTLDKAVYGHEKPKRQIERIIAQWVNGKNSGYCLGLEGPPGVGKTSIIKDALSDCLKDENGSNRPFHMIQLGGDSNGSSIIGHSYTYVGSTWGSIVQILIDSKCMNPIIFIDEIDKVSKTEHGKEIIGILTHLLDPTQNDVFQDKYFSGIELDLSKALFVLSYNDPELIDRILLDRVHRIKFDNLSLEDKIVIAKKYVLPEIYGKMGLEGIIEIADDVLKFIIEEYTCESGVRKMKQILFEIVGEINLSILKNNNVEYSVPINISINDIKTKYFKDKKTPHRQLIHNENKVGVINCLWANNLGAGGILGASAKIFPSDKFLDLKMTGLLDKMMEESFQISLTNAFNLLSEERKLQLNKMYNGDQKFGIHLHMGDGGVSKSGTSAGIAITILMYSLLSDIKIKNDFAVTGEASDLNGKVGEIGALSIKITSGIKAGVKNFIFPHENEKDYKDFMEKYKNTDLVKGIEFYPINHVNEAIALIMEK
jgi:ATP-dependent Lon protease